VTALRPKRRNQSARVMSTRLLTPQMARITLAVPRDDELRFDQPTQWLKLFVPHPDTGEQVGRAYTVREQREGELDLDIVLHGGGPLARWAETASVGEVVAVRGPRGWFSLPGEGVPYLLAGDESACPAIASVLDFLPVDHGPVTAFIEVDGPDNELPVLTDAGVELHWLHREGAEKGKLLVSTLRAMSKPVSPGVCWFAGEAGAMHDVRRHMIHEWQLEPQDFHVKGYWKSGLADHRE
jgi:NADPH-dependent ferric siderophore reductase